MISSISNSITSTTVSHNTREVIDTQRVNKVVNVDKVDIEKNVVTTNVIHKEQLNYIYNIQHRIISQPVNQLGNTINIAV